MSTGDTKFSVMLSLFTWMQRSKSSAKKRSKFRKFLDKFCSPDDYFSAIRLILPSLDRERGSYGLKESVLATALIDALGMARDSPDALRLINWRKGGAATGANAGNFALVAAEVLQRRQGTTSGGLTIRELNDLLDCLASSENRAEKVSILSTMINKTNAQEMKWIVMIILKDLKLGVSEKSIFHEFHPDAEDLFNVTCDLKLVCEKLQDRRQRHKRQDIEVGKAVRPQLAKRIGDATTAWKELHGKEVVVECKFDGDRIQIHKNGSEIHYYSRNFLDHSEYEHAMSDIIRQNILVDRCILDGEMLVWDTSLNRFADFGSNQEIAKAARDGLNSERQLCYVAFDVLYVGDTSVIHQTLKERHELLQKVVKPLKGRLEILIPNGGLNNHQAAEPCWSRIAYSADDIERFFKETVENRDEGIVLKDLGSKWEPGDRSGKWLKLKPDYIHAGSDLDVLIIGGYYGSGRRGGEVAQFLVGLAERPSPNTYPRRFMSFCRVGTGLSDEELDALITKLKPHFRKYEYPKKAPPSFYQVTNNSKERPDVWIESPEKSIILSITSDIRTIDSEVFAAPYSLRFPRIDRVRYDKAWHECLDVQTFVELVHSSNGTTQRGKEHGKLQHSKPKRLPSSKRGEKKNVSIVPSHFIQTNVTDVKGKTSIFSNMMFYFINVPPGHSLESLHKMVVENGGSFSMNLNNSVTHCVAWESKGIKYQAAKQHGDIIHCSWVLDCCSQEKLIPLQPKYFLFLSESSKKKLQEEIDEFSDSYYLDLDLSDIKQLLDNTSMSLDSNMIEYYKKKYCPKDKWSRFRGCCVYFHVSVQTLNHDWRVLLDLGLRRLELEICMGGGKISNDLTHATHVVVIAVPGSNLDFSTLSRSFASAEQRLLLNKRLHVVVSQWVEDSLEREKKLPEEMYSLKPHDIEELDMEERKDAQHLEATPYLESKENQNISCLSGKDGKEHEGDLSMESSSFASPVRDNKRKRVTTAGRGLKKGKIAVTQKLRPQARIRKKPAKISEDKFEDSDTNEKCKKDVEMTDSSHGNSSDKTFRVRESAIIKGCESSQRGSLQEYNAQGFKPLDGSTLSEQEIGEDLRRGDGPNRISEIETGRSKIDQDREKTAKHETIDDPLQAMLWDMIPSLAMKKPMNSDPVREDENPVSDPVRELEPTTNPVSELEIPASYAVHEVEKPASDRAVEPEAAPSKKKRVSYKDVASQLLKDF